MSKHLSYESYLNSSARGVASYEEYVGAYAMQGSGVKVRASSIDDVGSQVISYLDNKKESTNSKVSSNGGGSATIGANVPAQTVTYTATGTTVGTATGQVIGKVGDTVVDVIKGVSGSASFPAIVGVGIAFLFVSLASGFRKAGR